MTSERVLGIDLGTTNSAVGLADGTRVRVLADAEGNRLVPSVVSFHPQGDVLVGYPARERRLIDAKNTIYSVKRLIGRPFDSEEVARARSRFAFDIVEGPNHGVAVCARGQTFSLPEISAFVLREVRQIAEQAIGEECSRAVITVPANFNELQRAATKAAGKVAGLEVLRILNEPTAAALAYGYGQGGAGARRERLAIYDFGGGTFDVTLLELTDGIFEVIGTAGDTFLGGDDVDLLVAEEMANAFLAHHRFDPRADPQAFERLTAAAEWSKCQLTTEPEVHVRIEELAHGAGGQSLDLTFSLSRAALENLARPLIERTLIVCDAAFKTAGITATQLDGVILVGGSTRMPLVRSMVKHYFGLEPRVSIDPDLVVAQGAALQGYVLRADRGSLPPSKPLARVALRKAALAEPERRARRHAIVEEIAAARPKQPAFAPRPPPPPLPRPAPPSPSAPPASTRSVPPPLRAPRPLAQAPAVAPPPTAQAGPSVERAPIVAVGVAMGGAEDRAARGHDADAVAPPAYPTPLGPAGGAPAPLPLPTPLEPLPSLFDDVPSSAAPFGDAPALAPSLGARSSPPFAAPPVADAGEIVGRGGMMPLLLDVTPHTLGVETVGGYCEVIVRRNAAIPVEQTRVFTTASDGQSEVCVRIVQGESRRLEENELLGEVILGGLRSERRGQAQVAVTFVMDANGTLAVSARDIASGRVQSTRIQLVGDVSEAEIERMRERQSQALGA